ncbi:AAA domain-containing protein [Bdellovibrio bacteriovorus]|uniref:Superfamily I DNA and RNA helicases and helicase subunits n=1 Tax=Bdellovibrio bacteriovorus str. Tiberius TaxID=1069642 RepID=K7ZBE2_BDEBC|nr:Superfamily I DNA and RNA helicases and helicase subunits [Bdellovibrio bacteriovorus str. Tiberius]
MIQGPPGSGKSQTIVNLIADYLAKGKKVLFVSEKRPALDVVYNRMKGANIESQAVLIHSSDLNKSDLYKSFLEMAAAAPCEVSQREWHDLTESLDHTKKEMNAYADALSAENQKSGLSHSDLIVATSLVDQNFIVPDVYSKFSHLNYERIKRFSRDFGLIQDLLSKCSDLQNSPWMYRKPDVVKTNILEFKLRDLKNSFDSSIDKVKSLNAIMSETAGDVSNDIYEEIGKLQDHGALPLQYEALWNKSKDDLRTALSTLILSLKAALARLEKHKSSYCSIVPDADPEVVKDLEVYYSKPRGIIDWFSGVYWRQRDLRKNICHDWNGTNRQFAGYREYRESFDELHLLADSFNSQVTLDVDKHTGTRAWVEQQIGRLQNLELFLSNADLKLTVKMKNAALGSLEGFNDTVGGISKIKAALQDIKAVKEESNRRWAELNDYITNVPSYGDDSVRSEFVGKMIDSLPDLEVVDKADLEIRRIEDLFEIQDLKGTINKFFSKVKVRWTDVLESTMLNIWTEQVITSDPTLRSFSRDRVVSLVDSFRNSSEMHKKGSQEAVHQSFAMRWTSSSDRSGIPLLRREAEKQRKVLSPREIMEKGALATMMQLKPCWLMSPLSISQILPLQKGLFDVIIFDEASQVRVEDAIPSIYRASTMIVVGDNKQMPPTNFFSGGVIDDDEDDFEIEPSVLDLASMVYPSVLLEWHYRSKSESLIAFSNRAFYGGKLIAAPNPQMMTAGGALKFNLVQNGYFTTKSGNETEAEVLVDDLFERIRLNPDRSYGVIAMGQKQANAIDEAIEKKIDRDPEARRLYERALAFKDGESDAGLFVKNLENVQGDERDVIILSVGYAPAAPGKKLRMNFGPLSKKGGGRRLNVAATRAKSEMHVYCSFDPGSIPVDEESFSKNPDLCVFGRYLTYSKAVSDQNLELAMDILNSFPIAGTITNRKSSRFALDVKRRLEENGHKVSAEIGSSGFFIDLGIHHPVIQSNFALGIECDGAIFHSTPYARDRDKIREALLKSRGWKIERIWSQDWSRDWRSEVIRIERALLGTDKISPPDTPIGEVLKLVQEEE